MVAFHSVVAVQLTLSPLLYVVVSRVYVIGVFIRGSDWEIYGRMHVNIIIAIIVMLPPLRDSPTAAPN